MSEIRHECRVRPGNEWVRVVENPGKDLAGVISYALNCDRRNCQRVLVDGAVVWEQRGTTWFVGSSGRWQCGGCKTWNSEGEPCCACRAEFPWTGPVRPEGSPRPAEPEHAVENPSKEDTFERPAAGVIKDKAVVLRWLCRITERVAKHHEHSYAADCFCGDNEHGHNSPSWHTASKILEFVEEAVISHIERVKAKEREEAEGAFTSDLVKRVKEGADLQNRVWKEALRALALRSGQKAYHATGMVYGYGEQGKVS